MGYRSRDSDFGTSALRIGDRQGPSRDEGSRRDPESEIVRSINSICLLINGIIWLINDLNRLLMPCFLLLTAVSFN